MCSPMSLPTTYQGVRERQHMFWSARVYWEETQVTANVSASYKETHGDYAIRHVYYM